MRSRMIGLVRRHAVALVALTVALGGTAYAAKRIGGDDLKPYNVQVKDRTVKPGDTKYVKAKCKPHHRYVSGGYDLGFVDKAPPDFKIYQAGPLFKGSKRLVPKGYAILAMNAGAEKQLITTQAVCMKP
jgi:hypothetical protein